MPDPNVRSSRPPDSEQVIEAVSFFEQMLQTMPEDRVSLEVLSQAYEQAGDAEQACAMLSRLARVIERDGDVDAGRQLRHRLALYSGNAVADAALEQLTRFLSAPSSAAPAAPAAAPAAATPDAGAATASAITIDALQLINGPAERRAIVTQELDFAWLLHEQGMLTEDQYASIVSDITDLSASATPVPVSVLHLYHDRQLPNIDRVLTFASEKSAVPLLPLTSFDPQAGAYGLLPLDYLIIKGVIPFELMSRDLLVGTLNPLNEKLRLEMEKLTGRRCHFYLVQPSDFDATIDKIRKLLQGPAAAKK
ncbi:MAG: hypothetical protein WCI17_11710 [bacterium]|jgi:hypothetical protein